MSTSICLSCHSLLRLRLCVHVHYLQQTRRCVSTKGRLSLSCYHDTTAPTTTELEAAENFFLTHKPRKLWTATEWRKHNDAENTSSGLIPEVAFLGRSNVGKSSLLNALLLSPALNYVGSRPGKTRTMHAWAVSPVNPKTGGAIRGMKGDMETKCALLDMPGYGYASHDDWGEEIISYLKNRKQLKRAFVLVDGTHGLKSGDLTMLRLLRKQSVPAQVVVSKSDRLDKTEGMQVVNRLWEDIQKKLTGPGLDILGEVLVVGSLGDGRNNDTVHYSDMQGVHEVQWAVLRAAGLDDYAMSLALQHRKGASTALQQGVSKAHLPVGEEEDLLLRSEKGLHAEPEEGLPASISTSFHDATRQLQPRSQPGLPSESQSQTNRVFSWPAKLRQPLSSIAEVPSKPQSSHHRALGYMDTATLPSKFSPSYSEKILEGQLSVVPERPSIDKAMSSGREERMVTSDSQFEHSRRNLVAKVARQVSLTPATWTGSAVGGMADLEAMMNRTSKSFSGERKRLNRRPAVTGRQPTRHTEQSSQEELVKRDKLKRIWSGSAVGGMADLEEMMARTSRPAGGGKRPVTKHMRNQRYG